MLATLCAATIGVALLTPLGMWIRAAAVLAVALAFADALRVVALLRGRRGVRGFRLARDRSLKVRDASGREREGRVQDGSFVAPWLTIVRWRPEGARFDRTFLLVPGMLDPEAFRRLRVLLRWQ